MQGTLKIDPFGFREYDARWLYPNNINLQGIEILGKGLGSQIINHTKKNNPRIIVGHDYRSYSEEIKLALKKGLVSTGCFVEDIGLSLSPMVYFAQFNLNSDAVAMVTASHNENGWTGVKMGIKKGLTHAPEEMKELKDITLNQKFNEGKGSEKQSKEARWGSFAGTRKFSRGASCARISREKTPSSRRVCAALRGADKSLSKSMFFASHRSCARPPNGAKSKRPRAARAIPIR